MTDEEVDRDIEQGGPRFIRGKDCRIVIECLRPKVTRVEMECEIFVEPEGLD